VRIARSVAIFKKPPQAPSSINLQVSIVLHASTQKFSLSKVENFVLTHPNFYC